MRWVATLMIAIDIQQDSLDRLLSLQRDSLLFADLGVGSLPFSWDLSEKLFRILFRIQQGEKFSLLDRCSCGFQLISLSKMIVNLGFRQYIQDLPFVEGFKVLSLADCAVAAGRIVSEFLVIPLLQRSPAFSVKDVDHFFG